MAVHVPFGSAALLMMSEYVFIPEGPPGMAPLITSATVGKSEHTPGAQEHVASFMALLVGLRLLPGEGRLLLISQKCG